MLNDELGACHSSSVCLWQIEMGSGKCQPMSLRRLFGYRGLHSTTHRHRFNTSGLSSAINLENSDA